MGGLLAAYLSDLLTKGGRIRKMEVFSGKKVTIGQCGKMDDRPNFVLHHHPYMKVQF
jgi:hypothetical protein